MNGWANSTGVDVWAAKPYLPEKDRICPIRDIEDGDLQLDLTSDFYKGDEKTDEEIGDLLRNAHCINIVGEKSVALAIKEGIIDDSGVKKISGIPYVQGVVD